MLCVADRAARDLDVLDQAADQGAQPSRVIDDAQSAVDVNRKVIVRRHHFAAAIFSGIPSGGNISRRSVKDHQGVDFFDDNSGISILAMPMLAMFVYLDEPVIEALRLPLEIPVALPSVAIARIL